MKEQLGTQRTAGKDGAGSRMLKSDDQVKSPPGPWFTFMLLGPHVLLCKAGILPTSNTTESDSD